jgi:nucleolar MIF4G domain-containing protein 1
VTFFLFFFKIVIFLDYFQLRVEDILIRGLKWSKLLDPEKKGQWWLSGNTASTMDNVEEVAGTIDREVLENQKMLQIAAAQRMNTDARRQIFCIIMSGEDYIDAFVKLLRLNLQGKQVGAFFILFFLVFG